MTPIHELLSRIRWDPAFAGADYALGYWDRVLHRVVRIPLGEIRMDASDRFAFQCLDEEGFAHSVPYHRIVEVYRDGALIWRRLPPAVRG